MFLQNANVFFFIYSINDNFSQKVHIFVEKEMYRTFNERYVKKYVTMNEEHCFLNIL